MLSWRGLNAVQEMEKGKEAVSFVPAQLVMDDARDWANWREDSVAADYSRFEEEYEDDEEVEAFYFSSAAGSARILGNRRFGENGYISAGRMQARPVAPARTGKVCNVSLHILWTQCLRFYLSACSFCAACPQVVARSSSAALQLAAGLSSSRAVFTWEAAFVGDTSIRWTNGPFRWRGEFSPGSAPV